MRSAENFSRRFTPGRVVGGPGLALALALVTSGCTSDSNDDDDGDDGPSTIAEADALGELQRAHCELARACGCLDDDGLAQCREFVAVAWSEVQIFAAGVDATYQPDNVGEVIDVVEQIVCVGDGQYSYELYSRATRANLGHRPVYGGQAQAGETCGLLSQLYWLHVDTCAPGLVCTKLDFDGIGTCEPRVMTPGTLPLVVGDNCQPNGTRGFCPEGSHCSSDSETCVVRSGEGEPCDVGGGRSAEPPLVEPSWDYGCAYGLYCELATDTCEALPGDGEPCIEFSGAAMHPTEPRCEPGLRCASDGRCVAPTAQLGEPCLGDDDCTPDGLCVADVCRPADATVCHPR